MKKTERICDPRFGKGSDFDKLDGRFIQYSSEGVPPSQHRHLRRTGSNSATGLLNI